MTIVIDAITHQLNGAHIAREIQMQEQHGESSFHIVFEAFKAKTIMNMVRVSMSQLFDRNGVPKPDRYGLKASDIFPYSFDDGRPGRFCCIHLSVYRSPMKAMIKAMDLALEGNAL